MDTVDFGNGLVVAFRPGTTADHDFVFHSWLHAHWKHGDWPRRIPKGRYMATHDVVIARILERATLVVGCVPTRPAQIIGYAVGDERALHWVTRKSPFRGSLIGAHLVRRAVGQGVTAASHWTPAAAGHQRAWGVTFDPFLIREFEASDEERGAA
jgi:hypothetical protein